MARTARTVGRVRTLALSPVVVLVGVCALASLPLFVLASSHAVGGNSDGATVVLEGAAMRDGHLLLGGWALSLDSFWTIDVGFYAVAVLVAGVRAVLMNVVPAVLAALVFAACAGMAGRGLGWRGRAGAAVTVFVVLALPSRALAGVLVAGPLHVGTVLWCLLAFASWRRGLRGGRVAATWTVASAVLLAAGLLGDLQAVPLGVLPLVAGALVAGWRSRRWRVVARGLLAPFGGVVLAVVVRAVAVTIGTFTIAPANPFASGHQILRNLTHLVTFGAALLGVSGGPFGATGVPGPLEVVHLCTAALLLAGCVAVLVSVVRGVGRTSRRSALCPFHLDDVLLVAVALDLGAFVVLPITNSAAYARYLTAGLVYATTLGARLVGRALDRDGRSARVAAAVLVAVTGLYGAGFGLALRGPDAGRPAADVAAFLAARGLTDGVGDYWSASIVTVESAGAVAVRPVIAHDGRLVRYGRQSDATWYEGARFSFYVYDTALIWNGDDRAVALATFGRPAATFAVGSYRILVFHRAFGIGTSGWSGS